MDCDGIGGIVMVVIRVCRSGCVLSLFLPPQLRWDCGRIVNRAGIETIAILNTALSTANSKRVVKSYRALPWRIVPHVAPLR